MAKKVLIIGTGGTIASVKRNNGYVASVEVKDIIKLIPEINKLSQIKLAQPFNINCWDLGSKQWAKIAQIIYDEYFNFNGFVIAHGTDALHYTSAALSFMLQNLGKPVILTGSMIPFGELNSDAQRNLIDSVRVALSKLAEVAIVFNGRIIRGTKAKKVNPMNFNALRSINFPYLGYIKGKKVLLSKQAKLRRNIDLVLKKKIDDKVFLLKIYPGMDPSILKTLAEKYHGLVIEAFGMGNFPILGKTSFAPFIKKLTNQGKIIISSSQCLYSSINMKKYIGGKKILNAGAIPSDKMTPETALVKLMWILGQTKERRIVRQLFEQNLAGEKD